MLKVKTFILLLIISCSLFIKGQIKADIEVNYETKIQKDSLNTYSSDIFYYTLLTNKNNSYYFSREEKEYFDVLNGKSMLNPENSIKSKTPQRQL